ncbi:MAG: hypothetical protein QW100_02620 [Thermoplasmatales archaeon]
MKIHKFQTTQLKLGPFEGAFLYRLLTVSTIVTVSFFFFNFYGLVSLFSLPLFLVKSQNDYLDEIIIKKVKGITIPNLLHICGQGKVAYEIFGTNFGFSEYKDNWIILAWSSLVNTFSEDMIVMKVPYRIPVERFLTGFTEYDSLFKGLEAIAYAYFVIIESSKIEEFESTMSNFGISFVRLNEEEARVIDDLI